MNKKVLIISTLFVLSLSVYSFRLSAVFYHYAIFNDSFTEMYCINKDKPEMECNGKCHLKKELTKSQNTNNQKIDAELFFEIRLYVQNLFSEQIELNHNKKQSKSVFFYMNLYSSLYKPNIDKPPIFSI